MAAGDSVRRTPGFRIEEATAEDGTRILDVSRRAGDGHGADPRPAHPEAAVLGGNEAVVVDLSAVSFLDSSGASALLLSVSHALALGRTLVFVCPEASSCDG